MEEVTWEGVWATSPREGWAPCWQLTRKQGPQTYSCKELDSVNDLCLKVDSSQSLQMKAQLALSWFRPCEILSREPPQTSNPQNCEIINGCCFKMLSCDSNRKRIQTARSSYLYSYARFADEETGAQRSSHLPEVSQLLNIRSGI